MNSTNRKTLFSLALGAALGLTTVNSSVADPITSFQLGDVDDDGLISDFAFFAAPSGSSGNAFGTFGETGCVNAANGDDCDPVAFDIGVIGTDVFSTGFNFGGTGTFAPNVTGNMSGAIIITDSDGNLDLTFSALDFGGLFGGIQFFLAPDDIDGEFEDPAFPLVKNADGTFDAVIRWIGTINEPASSFNNFPSNWRLEGLVNVVDGPPEIFINNGGFGASGDVTSNVAPDTPYVDQGAVCQDVLDGQIIGPEFTTTDNNPNSPSTGPDGSQFTVVYDCTDSGLNPAQATRSVEVGADTEPPVVTLGVGAPETGRKDSADGSLVDILVGVAYVDAGATCVDNRDGDIPLGSVSPPFTVTPDPAVVNTNSASTGNIIQFSCDDTEGNGPTLADRTVDVFADDEPPEIELIGANPLTVAVGSVYSDPGAVCTDTNPVDEGSVDISDNLDINPTMIDTGEPGTTIVTYNCIDAAGVPAPQVTRTVNVVAGQNFRIESMTIADLDDLDGDGTGGDADGIVGCFKFASLDTITCDLANRFSSDGSAVTGFSGPANATLSGTGTDLDDDGNPIGLKFDIFQPITEFKPPEFGDKPQPVGPISPGFMFTGFPFVPVTTETSGNTEPPSGFVTVSGDTGIITMQNLPFSGLYNSASPNLFFLGPDPGTLSATVTAINDDDDGTTRTFNYLMTWSHIITSAEDPTGAFVNFKAFWRLEGVITANSVPFVVNNPPQVTDFSASQSDRDPTTIIVTTEGPVTASVTATDPDDDEVSYDWSQSPVTPIGPTDEDVFIFDPADLAAGEPLVLKVIVTDDVTDPLSVEAELILNVDRNAPELSESEDSDGDGIDDATEGFGDEDNDGIPDYQDPIDGNVDPGRNRVDYSDPSRGDIVTSAGRLRLGQVTTATGDGIFVATTGQIAMYGGPGVTPTDNAKDILSDVEGIGPIGGGIREFIVDGLDIGESVRIVIPQDQPMPELPYYRKFTAAKGWVPFSSTSGNELASAPKLPDGDCPPPGDPAYDSPLDGDGNTFIVEGDECIRLTIVEGGVNDGDFIRNGVIVDPGVPAGNGPVSVSDPGSPGSKFGGSGGGGCVSVPNSLNMARRADWWILGLFLVGLGLHIRRVK